MDKDKRELLKTSMTVFGWSPVRGVGVYHPEHGIVERGRDGKLHVESPRPGVNKFSNPEYVDWGCIKTRTVFKMYDYLVEKEWI